MSIYIRKSVKFGPLRFNYSKSGIGVSVGVNVERLAFGPRGTYIHLGSKGVYYHQKIDGSISDAQPEAARSFGASFGDGPDTVKATNVSDLIESSDRDTLAQINSRIQQPTIAWVIGIFSTILAGATASLSLAVLANASLFIESVLPVLTWFPVVIAVGIWFLGMWIAWVTNQHEKLAQTTTLEYTLDDTARVKFAAVQAALDTLSKSACIWRVVSQMPTWDWKRNAGATSLINRKRIEARYMSPPFVQTRIKVNGLLLDSKQLFFLPDQLFIFQNGHYDAVSYSSLQVRASPTSFIEDEGVPHDAQTVGHTWRYVRKDGGPDMRFKSNRQIPIAQYGHIELLSQTGLGLHLQVSNLAYAHQFTQALLDYILYCQTPNARSSSSNTSSSSRHQYQDQTKREARQESAPKEDSPYTVLNVSQNSTWEEISAAYRKMAQMYHPDKVAGLAPEYREIAERRMRAINAAYEQLEHNFRR
ncbi:MAG TPA: DUF4236 domain-containing protein [Anaerolineae bacterium]|nr:DUF4236 domain-containing protein [Anaerolineae bacterium]